jgi:hypothetical protein
MSREKIAIVFYFLLGIQLSYAQVRQPPKEKNGLDDKYALPPASPFNTSNKNKSENSSEVTIKNTVKYCPTLLLRQKTGFFYERKIGDAVSLTLGVGKAFGKDIIEAEGMDAFSLRNNIPGSAAPGIVIKYAEYAGSSPFFAVGLKLFYFGEAFNGAYVDLSYKHERMDYTVGEQISSYKVTGAKDASYTMNGFNFGLGFEAVSGKKNNITHDFNMGFGFKNYMCTEFKEYQVPSGYSTTKEYRRSAAEIQLRVAPAMNISYSIGFGF